MFESKSQKSSTSPEIPESEFRDDFLRGSIQGNDLSYREHIASYKNFRDYPNILYLTYESVVTDIKAAIRVVAEFVEVSEENFFKLKNHLQFDNMKSERNLFFPHIKF